MSNKKHIKEVLEFTTAKSIRKSLNKVFYGYVINNRDALPTEFDEIAYDFQLLVELFENIDSKKE